MQCLFFFCLIWADEYQHVVPTSHEYQYLGQQPLSARSVDGWMDGWISAVFLSDGWIFRNIQINKEEDVWDFDLRVFHEWTLNILKISRSLLHPVMWRGISLSHRFTRPWFDLPKVWWCVGCVVFNNPEGPIAVCRRRCLCRNPCYHPFASLCVAEMDGGGNMELSWNGCFIIHQTLFLSRAHPNWKWVIGKWEVWDETRSICTKWVFDASTTKGGRSLPRVILPPRLQN